MAKAIHTVLHIPMGDCSVGPCPETSGSEGANRMGFNSFAPVCLRNDEDDINVKLEPYINRNLKEPCTRRNAYGHAIEETSRGAP